MLAMASSPAAAAVTLDDKYLVEAGRIYLTGVQALVRLPLMQRQRDAAAGLDTAGFISGYRGSPLGTYDNALVAAREHLAAHRITFVPGVNEDLAATALWGTQQVSLYDDATVEGVFGIWYGKGPGVDRSTDALKHANAAGTSRHGGVLLLAGDDHGCQSSTSAHQSEHVLIAAMIPVLNPATVQDYLDFGLMGFALSRYAGVWVGFKTIAEAVESSATVDVGPDRVAIVVPTDFTPPPDGLNLRWPDPPLAQERRLHGPKMEAIHAFARANAFDRLTQDAPAARFGIAATGKAYLDVRQALDDLGIDTARAAELGLRVYKIGLSWPLEPTRARAFAAGLEEIFVVEEKRPIVEDQLVRLLYGQAQAPRIVGKRDDAGAKLLPSEGELSPATVAAALVARLTRMQGELPWLRAPQERVAALQRIADTPATYPLRAPFFCSGCPHNTSTRVPEGSRALAGIGCHYLAIHMPRQTKTFSHMGGEGAAWIGQAPYLKQQHVFQNIGDGTYFHSGLLAMRAVAAAGVNLTYKILFNDAVAMTGGQQVEGGLTVPRLTHQVLAEGARRIVVVSETPERFAGGEPLAPGVTVRHRDELDAVQRELRDIPGMTVLVYDQVCAAEKRRRRKRGRLPEPPLRVFINEAVCEGCGDCSEKSNCVSIKPVDTPLGRKRAIDQSACNKDMTCLKGFCPSFVTVRGARVRQASATAPAGDLPAPITRPLTVPCNILVTGIGGTGVITIGALLGMAAHIEGKGASVLDFTGMAQKNGAVTSHVRIAACPAALHAVRVGAGAADVVLGCDMTVAASPASLSRMAPGTTRAVINANVTPTAGFVVAPDLDLQQGAMQRAIQRAAGADAVAFLPAGELATALLGDSIATNLFVLGYAVQRGWIPLAVASIEQAIDLNGTAVASSRAAFRWGRLAAHDLPAVESQAGVALVPANVAAVTLADLVADRMRRLTEYQDAAYAARFRQSIDRVAAAEARVRGQSRIAEAAARSLYQLMAYKDEYEVARLYTAPEFRAKLAAQFDAQFATETDLRVHLAPPLFARRDAATGEPRKTAFGPWMFTVFRALAPLRRLRGTPLDVFGRTAERQMERRLIVRFETVLARLAAKLDLRNADVALEIARLPQDIRGFGHVKAERAATAEARLAALLADFERAPAVAMPA